MQFRCRTAYSLKQYGEKVRELYNHNTSDNCQANSGNSNGISNSVGSGITLNASWSIKVAPFISSFWGGMWFLIRLFHKRKQQIFLILIGLGIAVTLGTAALSHWTRGKRRWKSKLLTTLTTFSTTRTFLSAETINFMALISISVVSKWLNHRGHRGHIEREERDNNSAVN